MPETIIGIPLIIPENLSLVNFFIVGDTTWLSATGGHPKKRLLST